MSLFVSKNKNIIVLQISAQNSEHGDGAKGSLPLLFSWNFLDFHKSSISFSFKFESCSNRNAQILKIISYENKIFKLKLDLVIF